MKDLSSVPVGVKISNAFTPKGSISKNAFVILGISMFVVVFAIWSALSYSGSVSPLFLPTPSSTLSAAFNLFQNNYIGDIGITVWRVMMGFLITAAIGVPVGILIGVYSPMEALIEPITSFTRYLPATIFIPLFILWIGVNDGEKIAVIVIGSLPQLILMIAVDAKKVSNSLIEVSYTLGTTKSQVLWKIILHTCMPAMLDSLRMVLGWAWTYVTVAEMVGAESGIGYMTIQAQRMLNISNIFVGIFSIGLIGLAFDYIFKMLGKVLFPWN